MKKFIIVLLVLAIAVACCCTLLACTDNDKVTVGVLQYATHSSLDNCYDGFKQGLAEKGYTEDKVEFVFINANADYSAAQTGAATLVNRSVDLICGIATPAATCCIKAAEGDIPVVFSAVSDPVGTGYDAEVNVTGTSDRLPLAKQLELIKAFLPDAQKIGVVYTTSEQNSITQIAQLQELATTVGVQILSKGISASNEIPGAVDYLISQGVDCLNNLTDNTVVDSLTVLLDKAAVANIPVFGSEIEQVKNGCLAAQSIDYVDLGKKTGYLAAQILSGEKAADDLDFVYIEESVPVYNSAVMANLALTLPSKYSAAQNVAE